MDSGNIEVVRCFHKHGVQFTARAIAFAAGKGALNCLQYGRKKYCERPRTMVSCNVLSTRMHTAAPGRPKLRWQQRAGVIESVCSTCTS